MRHRLVSLLEVGNGGWAGSINYGGLRSALSAGFATASTDTGHTGGSPSFAIERPEAVIDYGYRAVHEMTLKAKHLVSSYMGGRCNSGTGTAWISRTRSTPASTMRSIRTSRHFSSVEVNS